MRKISGRILLALGGFLLVAGVLATAWAPGVVKKTPIDVDTTTYLSGTVQKLNADTGELESHPIKILSQTKNDTDASTDTTGVWVQTACVVLNDDGNAPNCVDATDPRLVSATVDVFATDRVSGLAVNDAGLLPADAVPHDGLVNKFPFDSAKTTYPYWDSTIGKAVDAVYQGTEDIAGVQTYKYVVTIKDAPIEILDGVQGTYDNVATIYVEPKTGAIQQQTQDQQRYLEDGTQVLDLKAEFTPEQVQTFADDAHTNMGQLTLMLVVIPLVGFIGGGLAVLGGAALLLTGRRRSEDETTADRQASVSLGG
ncbi:DUF3068 domain-containing protein [Nocardioides sp.]|uniref:DUF3068 domain-containing protein n=1 Tax=Nocardioides sp. TaxID=35761 RepID=UPI0031FF3513|nr:hypothetical protein [Nocardioides sp.]